MEVPVNKEFPAKNIGYVGRSSSPSVSGVASSSVSALCAVVLVCRLVVWTHHTPRANNLRTLVPLSRFLRRLLFRPSVGLVRNVVATQCCQRATQMGNASEQVHNQHHIPIALNQHYEGRSPWRFRIQNLCSIKGEKTSG